MDSCVACGAELGVGRFCLNCGHPIGMPAPAPSRLAPAPVPVEQQPIAPPVQAADPTPVAPTSPPEVPAGPSVESPGEASVAAPDPEPSPARPRRHEWDPREELLPYEEVDDLDSDVPIRGRAWIGWVAGAVLLMGLVLLLLRVFADGADVATDPAGSGSVGGTAPVDAPGEAAAAEAASEAPRGVGRLRELAAGAGFDVPATAPPTTDLDGNLVAYEAGQMGDGNPSTAWRTAGDATGQTLTVTLPEPGVVTRVGLLNGYAKQVAGVDWYPNNRRILSVTWGFDDGTSIEQTFAERPAVQRLKVPPVQTGTITLTITSVTPPGSGTLGRDYTAISEVSVTGRRAG